MKININDQLEQAHKSQLEEREGIIFDLFALDHALLYCVNENKLTLQEYTEFSKIIAKTYKYLKEGERI